VWSQHQSLVGGSTVWNLGVDGHPEVRWNCRSSGDLYSHHAMILSLSLLDDGWNVAMRCRKDVLAKKDIHLVVKEEIQSQKHVIDDRCSTDGPPVGPVSESDWNVLQDLSLDD